jgi:IS30 family transposase
MDIPASAMRASTGASTQTSLPVACCTERYAARRLAKNDMGGRERRGTIPNQVFIYLRPSVVAERRRFSDWEADLVIGAAQKQALVTMNERTSRYSLIAHVPFKTAQAVSGTMIALLRPFASCVHTLTTDNGKEFAQHKRIASIIDPENAWASKRIMRFL